MIIPNTWEKKHQPDKPEYYTHYTECILHTVDGFEILHQLVYHIVYFIIVLLFTERLRCVRTTPYVYIYIHIHLYVIIWLQH